MVASSEKTLIKNSQNGDVKAFEELIAAYQKQIYNIAFRLIGNYHDASDMAQETIIKIFRSIGGYRGEAAFSTWIYRITVNTCRDELNRRQRKKETSYDSDDGEVFVEIPDYSSIPENIMEKERIRQYLEELILSLSPEYRIVMVLREQNGFSYQEISDYLNLSIGTVKSRINRARRSLQRKILQDAEQYPEIKSHIVERRG